MNKKFYALEQTHGHISVYSAIGAPTLHIFGGKKERDEWVNEYNATKGDPNHSATETNSKVAYDAYSSIVDGVREWANSVVFH